MKKLTLFKGLLILLSSLFLIFFITCGCFYIMCVYTPLFEMVKNNERNIEKLENDEILNGVLEIIPEGEKIIVGEQNYIMSPEGKLEETNN